jgi:hypothetical protein
MARSRRPSAVAMLEDNPALPTCAAMALADHLIELGASGDVVVSGNDDNGVCP